MPGNRSSSIIDFLQIDLRPLDAGIKKKPDAFSKGHGIAELKKHIWIKPGYVRNEEIPFANFIADRAYNHATVD